MALLTGSLQIGNLQGASLLTGNAFRGGSSSTTLADCKGWVHAFDGPSNGFYALDPKIPDAPGSRALVLGVPLNFMEIVQPTTTLDDKRVLYLFGTAWNDITVSGILLLGNSSTRGLQLTKLLQWYEANRVSQKRGPVRVSLGTSAVDAYVVGLKLETASPSVNTQMFSIQMVTADVS